MFIPGITALSAYVACVLLTGKGRSILQFVLLNINRLSKHSHLTIHFPFFTASSKTEILHAWSHLWDQVILASSSKVSWASFETCISEGMTHTHTYPCPAVAEPSPSRSLCNTHTHTANLSNAFWTLQDSPRAHKSCLHKSDNVIKKRGCPFH